jgi:hypothetical protein
VDGDGIRRLHSRAQPVQAEEAAADAGGTRWRLETTVPPHGCHMGVAWVLEMAASLMAAVALDGRQFSAARCGACPWRAGCTTALGTAT